MNGPREGQPIEPQHPSWCDQERCEPPRRYPDGSLEWSHWAAVPIESDHDRCTVFLARVENLASDSRHTVATVAEVDAAGPFTADELEALADALSRAARVLRAGLDGTPGGLAAVIAAADAAGGAR